MKKIILTTVLLLSLIGNLYPQNYQRTVPMLFHFHKDVSHTHFGRNESLFWTKLKSIESIDERKRVLTSYTVDETVNFINHYFSYLRQGYDKVEIRTYINEDEYGYATIDKIIALRDAAISKNWDAMEKAANQLSFGYDIYLYY
jgi:hypothetical protein